MILQPDDIAIDYSGARPDPAAIVAADVKLVVRYISPRRDNPKNLTIPERDRLLDAGLSLLLVWEHTATDALQGAVLGAQHGAMAEAFAHDLGNPDAIPVMAAVDANPVQLVGGKFVSQIPAIDDYLGAFDAASGFPSGVYGNDQVVTAAHDAGVSVLGWQTRAWSAGRRSPHADCLQQIGFVHPTVQALNTASGGAHGRQVLDDNTVLRSFTAWSTSMPPTTPPPADPIKGVQDDMLYCECADDGDFWAIFFDCYANRVACPLGEMPDPDWNEFAAVQAAFGPLVKVPHAALQRLYDKRGRPQLPVQVVPSPTVPNHKHEPGGVQ